MLSIIKKWLGLEDKTHTVSVVQPRTELATELVPNDVVVETPVPVAEKAKKAAKPRKTPAAKTKTKTRKVKDN